MLVSKLKTQAKIEHELNLAEARLVLLHWKKLEKLKKTRDSCNGLTED